VDDQLEEVRQIIPFEYTIFYVLIGSKTPAEKLANLYTIANTLVLGIGCYRQYLKRQPQ
jgi:hypothetical protein